MKKREFMGIDEVGRSSLLGPFVIAGVRATDEIIEAWGEVGVTDSKRIKNRNKIKELSDYIKETALDYNIQIADAEEIDRYVSERGYNNLERDRARNIITAIGRRSCTIILDGPNIFNKKFVDEFINTRYAFDVKSYKKADVIYIVVGAASIIAKHTRDQYMDKMIDRYEKEVDMKIKGRGESCKETIKFLQAYKDKYNMFPLETRLSFKLFRNGTIF